MKGKIMSFRRGKTKIHIRHMIIEIGGVKSVKEAKALIGKEVSWKSPSGKVINGKITSSHGGKGLVRVAFEKGLPGQSLNDAVEIK